MNLSHVFTRAQAIEDGVLIRFEVYVGKEGGLIGPEFVETELEMIRIEDVMFPLGELIITSGAAEALNLLDALGCLMRHQLGDWGELDEEDEFANEKALKKQRRIFSAYRVDDKRNECGKVRFYIITEWDREATKFLLPGDY